MYKIRFKSKGKSEWEYDEGAPMTMRVAMIFEDKYYALGVDIVEILHIDAFNRIMEGGLK